MDFMLRNFLLSVSHFPYKTSHENLYKAKKNILCEWNITEKNICLVHDNAPNITRAVIDTGYISIRCFAHSLQICVKTLLKMLDWMRP